MNELSRLRGRERYGACADDSAGCREPFSKGASLPGSQPRLTGAEPLREHRNAAAVRYSRPPPRRAHDTLQPLAESVIVGYTL